MTHDRITIWTDILCPMCAPRAKHSAEYLTRHERNLTERALWEEESSRPERIKAAWSRYGGAAMWGTGTGAAAFWSIQIAAPPRLSTRSAEPMFASEKLPTETFDFRREITLAPTYTVTRIHCDGITVEETITS